MALLIYVDVDWSTCAPAKGVVDSSAIPNLKGCDSHVADYVICIGLLAWALGFLCVLVPHTVSHLSRIPTDERRCASLP